MSGSSGSRVAVVGGGPAGAVVALRLVQLGHHVTLAERQGFPRDHVGEALSPGVAGQLQWLGLDLDFLTSCGAERHGASALRWGVDWQVRSLPPGAVTVDRARFDAALLDGARAAGVVVLQPARAMNATFDGSWRIRLSLPQGAHETSADFLIDATGRVGFHRRSRRPTAPRTSALHALWAGTGAGGPRVAAGADHWIWASPIPSRGDRIMLFAAPGSLPRDRCALDRYYRERVAAAGVCRSGSPDEPLRLCDASAYRADEISGEAFLRVGEAAYALDPLSSSGVEKALSSAMSAAIVVNTMVRRPQDAGLARRFYEEQVSAVVARQARWAAATYAECSHAASHPFWAERARGGRPEQPVPSPLATATLRLSDTASFAPVPVVKADHIEIQDALVHPALERPLAFAAGCEVAPLLRGMTGTVSGIVARLRQTMPAHAAGALTARLIQAGVLVSAEPDTAAASLVAV